MGAKSNASGHHGDKIPGGRDLGAGSGAPTEAGRGYIDRKAGGKGRDLGSGKRSEPTKTGHQWGIKKGASSGSDSVSGIPDGVGGPFPSA